MFLYFFFNSANILVKIHVNALGGFHYSPVKNNGVGCDLSEGNREQL